MCLASLALKSSKEICLPFPSKFRWRIFTFLEQRGRKVETDKTLLKENCSIFRCRLGLCVRGRLRTLNSCHLFFLGIQANVLGASLSSTGPGRIPLHRAFVSRPLGTKGLGFGVIFFLPRTCRNVVAHSLNDKTSSPIPALCSLLAFLKRYQAMRTYR